MISEIQKIAVAGSGTMGLGIAQVAAIAGFKTVVFDINPDAIERAKSIIDKNLTGAVEKGKLNQSEKEATLSNIQFTSDFNEVKADLIIEAIVEKLEPKVELFTKLSQINNSKTIFATNTSSIPVTKIAAFVSHPERVVGMHFFNPAHIMKLVEVISGVATNPEIAQTVKEVSLKMGKVPVMIKDAPGFIVNRVARHYYVESLKILEENVSDIDTIDALLENAGFKMGPFKLMDLIGNDINFSVTKSLFDSFHYDSKFRPNRIQEQKVMAGHLGKKTGKGFYDYQ